LVEYWTRYFGGPERNGGLARDTVSDPRELRQLTAFFTWTAWASAATRPGTSRSYTNNFPYEPLAGNTATAGALIYSALSLVFLLGGTAAVLLAFGKFDYLGWHRRAAVAARAAALPVSDAQRATLKFMAIAALLFFGQTLIGGGVAHYRADPGSFYGIDLARLLPSNLLRTWHLQLAVDRHRLCGRCSVRRGDARPQRVISAAARHKFVIRRSPRCDLRQPARRVRRAPSMAERRLVLVRQQGWEYLEIGRFWQILLAIGLVFWFGLLWRAVTPAWRDSERRSLATLLLDRCCGDSGILPAGSVF
jgi:nitric oxide reductase subunit B